MSYQPLENNIDIYEEEMGFLNSKSNSKSNLNNSNSSNVDEQEPPTTVIEIHDNFTIEEDEKPTLIKSTTQKLVNFFHQFLLKKVYVRGFFGFLALFILNIIHSVVISLFVKDMKNTNEEDIELIAKLHPFLMISYACIAGPIIEELIFRKLLFGMLKKFSKILAYIVSCFLFAFGHFDTNISNQADPFGDPFFLYVPFGITVRDFKPVIQKKLKIGDELIRAIKIAHVDGLKPKYLPEDAPVVTDKGLQKNVVIGLMHSRPKGASRSKKSSAPRAKERAIVINI